MTASARGGLATAATDAAASERKNVLRCTRVTLSWCCSRLRSVAGESDGPRTGAAVVVELQRSGSGPDGRGIELDDDRATCTAREAGPAGVADDHEVAWVGSREYNAATREIHNSAADVMDGHFFPPAGGPDRFAAEIQASCRQLDVGGRARQTDFLRTFRRVVDHGEIALSRAGLSGGERHIHRAGRRRRQRRAVIGLGKIAAGLDARHGYTGRKHICYSHGRRCARCAHGLARELQSGWGEAQTLADARAAGVEDGLHLGGGQGASEYLDVIEQSVERPQTFGLADGQRYGRLWDWSRVRLLCGPSRHSVDPHDVSAAGVFRHREYHVPGVGKNSVCARNIGPMSGPLR